MSRRLLRSALAGLLIAGLVGATPTAAFATAGDSAAAGAGTSVTPAPAEAPRGAAAQESDGAAQTAPEITEQPETVTVALGVDAQLQVIAEHATAYQWQRLAADRESADVDALTDNDWTDLERETVPSAATKTLQFAAATADDAGRYRVTVTGGDGSTLRSEPAELIVVADEGTAPGADAEEPAEHTAATAGETGEAAARGASSRSAASTDALAPLAVVTQPENVEGASGAVVRMGAESSGGTDPVTQQWYRSSGLSASNTPAAELTAEGTLPGWIAIDRATGHELAITIGSSPNVNNRWYAAVFTDADGNRVVTNPAKLSITAVPTITEHPNSVGQTIREGETAEFSAAATSRSEMTVQWQSNQQRLANGDPDDGAWVDVAGATETTLRVAGANAAAQQGTFYRAVFSNEAGQAETYPSELRFFEGLDTRSSVTVTGESYGPVGAETNTFSIRGPNAVVKGDAIVIEGSGYLYPGGTQGSVAHMMIDASYSGDPNTLLTTRTIMNPVTGAEYADKRAHALIQAEADGTWRVEIPWPDEHSTDKDAAFFATNWQAGSQHMVRILTGTQLSGDYQRGISYRFTVVDEGTAVDEAPQITAQPADQTVFSGESAEFTAAASGTPTPTVQWQSRQSGGDWADIAGATRPQLVLGAVASELSGTQYRAAFTNSAGTAATEAAVLTVDVRSDIAVSEQPTDQTVEVGERAVFTAAAAGDELRVQWQRSDDGGATWEKIRGAFDTTFVLESVRASDADWVYRALFTNPANMAGIGSESAALETTARANTREMCGTAQGPDAFAGDEYCVTWPERVVRGEDIVVAGTGGFTAADDATGSVIGFTLGGFHAEEQSRIIYRKNLFTNPATGGAFSSRHVYAAVQAGPDGTWTATIPWPKVAEISKRLDGSDAFTQAELDERFAAGTQHVLHLDTGDFLASPQDVERRASLTFTVVDGLDDEVEAQAPSYLHHELVADDGATAWVPRSVDSRASFPLTGAGWVTKDGEAGSVIDVRLVDGQGGYHRHAGSAADPSPVAADPSIWQRVYVRDDGVLGARVQMPAGVVGGDRIAVELTTTDDGADLGDVARTLTSERLTVDGEVPPAACNPGNATYELAPGADVPAASAGGTLRLTGEGWCNTNTDLGSYIAIKINDGALTHVAGQQATTLDANTGEEHLCDVSNCVENNSIWYVIEAADDGSFDAQIPMPTVTDPAAGTQANTAPAIKAGYAYKLRIMTGTLASDPAYDGARETSRTIESPEFTVVCASCDPTQLTQPGIPTWPAAPVHATEDLTAEARGGVTIAQTSTAWTVTVPNAEPGEWLYANLYAGGMPQDTWDGQWFEVNGQRKITLPLGGTTLPAGTHKLSLQDRADELRGWGSVTVTAPAKSAAPGTTTVVAQQSGGGSGAAAAAPSKPRPDSVPRKPVMGYGDLTPENTGGVTAINKDGTLTVTFPNAEGGDWVYLFIYTESGKVVGVDWVQIGTDLTITLELGKLPRGFNKLAFADADGGLAGWVGINGPPLKTAAKQAAGPAVVGTPIAGGVAAAITTMFTDDWTLVLLGLAVLVLCGAAVAAIMLRAPVRPVPGGQTGGETTGV